MCWHKQLAAHLSAARVQARVIQMLSFGAVCLKRSVDDWAHLIDEQTQHFDAG